MLHGARKAHHTLIGGALLSLLTCLACAAPALAQSGDPVEDLRNALVIQLEERENPAALDLREKALQKGIAALRTINQLRRALVLTEWKDDPRENLRLRTIDLDARRLIADRMLNSLKRALQPQALPDVRLSAATFVGELDTSIRSAAALDHRGLAREMTAALAKVVETDTDSRVRQAAARSLGKINPEPKTAAQALEALMVRKGRSPEEAVAEKQAAATGLFDMIDIVSKLYKTGQTQRGVLATRDEVVQVATEIVPAAGIGSRDADALVRRTSVNALLQAANALNQVIPDPYLRTDFPTNTDRPLTEQETRKIRTAQDLIKADEDLAMPLMKALAKQGENLAVDLTYPEDATVRLYSRDTLEMMATARQRLLRRIESVPVLKARARAAADKPVKASATQTEDTENPNEVVFLDGDKKGGLENDPLLSGLEPGIDVISRGLRDPAVENRLASVQFLEMLGRELRAFPRAIAVLVNNGLCDPSLFVRWASARTLAWAAPLQPKEVVPALARDLLDPELEVRIAAAYTLGLYGKLAEPVLDQIIRATAFGDAEGREAAIQTLAKVVQTPNEPAVLALAAALKNEDPRVRREAAAALGQIGPNALLPGAGPPAQQPAIRALIAALRDRDNDVRELASEALLAIQVPLPGSGE